MPQRLNQGQLIGGNSPRGYEQEDWHNGKGMQPAQGGPRRPLLIVVAVVLVVGGIVAWYLWPSGEGGATGGAAGGATGTLTVKTDQPSEVVIDGDSYGNAPIKKQELSVGKHKITIRNEKTDAEKTYTKRISKGKLTRLQVSWRKNARKKASSRKDDANKTNESVPKKTGSESTHKADSQDNEPILAPAKKKTTGKSTHKADSQDNEPNLSNK